MTSSISFELTGVVGVTKANFNLDIELNEDLNHDGVQDGGSLAIPTVDIVGPVS